MSDAVAKLNKPQLRGLLHSQIKRNLIVAIGLSAAFGTLFRVFVGNSRKERYAEFYKNYDIDKEFNKMRNLGVFDSCQPDN